jgi:hypothetical protein
VSVIWRPGYNGGCAYVGRLTAFGRVATSHWSSGMFVERVGGRCGLTIGVSRVRAWQVRLEDGAVVTPCASNPTPYTRPPGRYSSRTCQRSEIG